MVERFKKKKADLEKLEALGFFREEQTHSKKVPIHNGDLELQIFVQGNKVEIKVFDQVFQEEYVGYKMGEGEFALAIKEEIDRILDSIEKEAFEPKWFENEQADRIAHLIHEHYHDEPAFLFKKDTDTGVFRNPSNQKWYGILLKHLNEEGKEETLLNVKLDKKQVQTLLDEPGYRPAYHMNKTYWVSIELNGILEDDEIMEWIKESHKFTETSSKSWVIPSKPDMYDVKQAFSNHEEIEWHRKANFQVDDLVFIYLSAPIQKIQFACQVTSIDPEHKTMKIKKIKTYENAFPLERLKQYGLKSVRGARHVPEELERLLLKTNE